VSEISWWRPPFIGSFRAGNFDFVFITAHVRWGDTVASRLPELQLLADWVADRRQEKYVVDKDVIVLGDFNIPSRRSSLFKAVTSKGLQCPPALLGAPGTDLARGKRYDQIRHDPIFTTSFLNHGGVLDFYCGDHQPLFPADKLTKDKFTFQLSDHLPLWIQIGTDTADELLDQVLNRGA